MNLVRELEMGVDVYYVLVVQCYIKIIYVCNCFMIIDRLMVVFIVFLMWVLYEM